MLSEESEEESRENGRSTSKVLSWSRRVAARLLVLSAASCSTDCPEGWELDDESAICQPPNSVTDAAEAALVTGIYGYGLQCAENDSGIGAGFCEPDGVACCGTVTVHDVDHVNGWPYDVIFIEIRPDGTFRNELPPNVTFSFGYGLGNRNGYDADGDVVDTFVLKEGEVRFFRAAVDRSD